ncbi:MAG: RHS repeat protein [Bacteroides sp.]|nr:RHS repeat protein [Bacteroides sp.]
MKQNIFTRLLCLFMALFSLPVFADNAPTPVLPTSPQAESIKRYGELDFDYSIGTPNISIPLFDIDHRGYKVPVKLQYIPSPLKPGYNYDVYGHGWNLSINSCISRRINYEPDEASNFALETDQFSNIYRTHGSGMMNYNLAYDPFSVTLPDGTAFDFYIVNYTGTIEYIVSNGRYVQISHTKSNNQITSFTITDEQGIVYTFAGADASFQGNGATNSTYLNTNVSWNLTNIKLPNSTQSISFTYGKILQSHYAAWVAEPTSRFKRLHYVNGNPANQYLIEAVPNYESYGYRMKLLTQICYGSTTVDFTYTKSDETSYNNHISTITLKDNGSVVRNFNFDITDSSLGYPGGSDLFGYLYSVTAQGPDSSEEGMTYRCEYQAKNSFNGVDHWGNLNYQSSSDQVAFFNFFCDFDFQNNYIYRPVPMTLLNNDADELAPYQKIRLSSMNVDPRTPASPNTHGVIHKLIYPTGGYTEFLFENHKFYTHTDSNGDYIHDEANRRIIEGGGFRIREVKNYTAAGKLSDRKLFYYGSRKDTWYLEHTGAGEPVVDPNILTYLSFSEEDTNTSIRNMVLGLSPQGTQTQFANPFADMWLEQNDWGYECTFSAQNFRRILNGRQAVVYPEVTVYDFDTSSNAYNLEEKHTAGKTVYTYDLLDVLASDTSFFEKATYHGNVLSYRAKKYRYANLIKKEEYRYKDATTGYQIARKESYEWGYSYNNIYDYIYNNNYFLDLVSPNTSLGSFFNNHYTNVGKAYLKKKITQDFGPSIYNVLKRETYSYNTRNQVTEKYREYGSNYEDEAVRYTYPEKQGDTSSASYIMAQRHIYTPLLETRETTDVFGEYIDMAGVKTDYAGFVVNGSTCYLPSKLYKLDANSGTYLLDKEIVSYASQCNPQEVIGSDGVRTIYLWSYNNRYLIAEIRNATLSQVTSAVSAVFGTSISSLGSSSSPSASGLQALHANSNLSNALVTTYTHKPLVGVTSITDPSGRTTYYDYDGLGRLKEAYYYEGGVASASNKRVLEANEYHYINQ